jgi:hypothetical protein
MFCPAFGSETINLIDCPADLNTRRNVSGSRLFNEVSGQALAVKNEIGSPLSAIQSGLPDVASRSLDD